MEESVARVGSIVRISVKENRKDLGFGQNIRGSNENSICSEMVRNRKKWSGIWLYIEAYQLRFEKTHYVIIYSTNYT